MALMAVQGVANLQAQWAIIGEFSNLPQEELLDWIQENTRPGELFKIILQVHAELQQCTAPRELPLYMPSQYTSVCSTKSAQTDTRYMKAKISVITG